MFLKLIKTESYKKGVLLSVIFNITAKGILFLLTIFIARFFGSNIKTDIYFFIYGTMVLLSGFFSLIDTAVLIPQSMLLREREGNEKAMALLNFFLRNYIIIGLVVVTILGFFGMAIFGAVSKFSGADILLYRNYFFAGSLYFFFMLITNYFNAILSSLKFFTIPMIISGINSCLVIVIIILLHERFDVLSVFIGGVAAYSFNIILLVIVMKKMAGWQFFTRGALVTKKIWGNIFYAEAGQLATFAGSFFPLFLLSGFGNGVLSVMNYGKNIADIPNTLLTAQLSNITGIKINELAARSDNAGINAVFLKSTRFLIFLLVPLSCLMIVFSGPIISILYGSSNLTAGDTSLSAKYLQYFSVVILSIGINAMVARVLIAMQLIRQSLWYQLTVNSILVISIAVLAKYYGGYGYPFGVIGINMLNVGVTYFICRKWIPFINYAMILRYTLVITAINAAIGAIIYFFIGYTGLTPVEQLFTGTAIYIVLLLLANRFLKLNSDLDLVIKGITQKLFR
jgi:putative peptidoglycan lipid II flippase